MKHILPILTASLALAATTASANFYYDYYQDPGKSGVDNEYWVVDDWNKYESGTDSFSYKDFSVARNSDWEWVGNATSEVTGKAIIDNNNFYRIHVLGDNVNLYLTDFVDNAGSSTNASALYNNIDEYGYRKLELVDGKYVATGDTVTSKLSLDDNGNPIITNLPDGSSSQAPIIDSINNNGTTVDRYKYHLGTFNSGDVIELYLKDLEGGEAYSYSQINEIDPATNAPYGADGAFGDGGYRVNLETDEMLNGYYYQDENLESAGYQGFGEGEEAKAARALASSKSMPLSALDPSGTRVYFGIIGTSLVIGGDENGNGSGGGGSGGTFGSPLPGGLQIALIAGLFGLGFWYIRRRKAIAD